MIMFCIELIVSLRLTLPKAFSSASSEIENYDHSAVIFSVLVLASWSVRMELSVSSKIVIIATRGSNNQSFMVYDDEDESGE